MASVSVPPSPRSPLAMSTRRPLATVPNGTNSPHRVSSSTAIKRPRAGPQYDPVYEPPPSKRQLLEQERSRTELQYDPEYCPPPSKKQVVEHKRISEVQYDSAYVPPASRKQLVEPERPESRSPSKIRYTYVNEGKTVDRGGGSPQKVLVDRKLQAARAKEQQSSKEKEKLQQWRRHYRKAFPDFIFYFDCVPADVRSKCLRDVLALGAREERFFSRAVTHVVTTRPIPPPVVSGSNDTTTQLTDRPVQTVNPSMLEKIDTRRDHATSSTDVLYRARQMGMKIWSLEKLSRVLWVIQDNDDAPYPSGQANDASARGRGDMPLSQALQNELVHGHGDRELSAVMKDMIPFKGPYIYVHDMEEKTRPVMIREYPKVARRQDGAWPQFRSAPLGRCPFIDEPPSRKELAAKRERKETTAKKAVQSSKKNFENRDPSPVEPAENVVAPASKAEGSVTAFAAHAEHKIAPSTRPVSPRKSSESFIVPTLKRTGPFHPGQEPAASGVQPSNITSAIRSQMVSSTAAAAGAKAGLSKEVHELKRKVLEKNTGNLVTTNPGPSYRPSDVQKPVSSSTKLRQLAEGRDYTQQDGAKLSKDYGHPKPNAPESKYGVRKTVPEKKRDPKPGYCENCRDRFDDFDEHIMSRKHRRFAQNPNNWFELDSILEMLARPLKEDHAEFRDIDDAYCE